MIRAPMRFRVNPAGVDTDIYTKLDRREVREQYLDCVKPIGFKLSHIYCCVLDLGESDYKPIKKK